MSCLTASSQFCCFPVLSSIELACHFTRQEDTFKYIFLQCHSAATSEGLGLATESDDRMCIF